MKKVKEHSLLLQYDRLKEAGAPPVTSVFMNDGDEQCCVKCGHTILQNGYGKGVCACKTGMLLVHGFPAPGDIAKPCRLFTEGDIV